MITDIQGNISVEELFVGQFVEVTKTIKQEEVVKFAEASGDYNPIHLDEFFASTSPFGGCIVHGALIGAYISGLIGMKLPGAGSIVVRLSLKFRCAVKVGSTVLLRIEVKQIDLRRGFVTISCTCSTDGRLAVTGEALIHIPRQE